MRAGAVDPRTVQSDAAVRRPLQPHDDLQERALAGPVGTDDGDDVAVVDPEGDAVDGREAAVALRDVVYLEEQVPSPATDGRESTAAT
jgi:hypothetical protein